MYNGENMRKSVAWKTRLTKEMGRVEKLAVLGVGNVLKGDDAVGVRTIEALRTLVGPQPCPKLLLLAAYEVPENYTGKIRDFQPTHTLIIDAVSASWPAGTVFVVDPRDLPDADISTHRTSLSVLARFLETTMRCRVLMLGVEPEEFLSGRGLTPAVQDAAEAISRYLAGFVRRRLRSSSASERRYS